MADYIGITEAQSNPFAPLTSELVKQLRDNPLAIAEGAQGAPRLYLRALERLQAGDQIRSRRDETITVDGDTAGSVNVLSFDFIQYGTIRASFEVFGSATDSGGRVERTRNAVTTTVFIATTNAVHNVDIDVLPGDRLQIVAFRVGLQVSNVRNARFQTNGQDLWPGSSARLEGNRAAT